MFLPALSVFSQFLCNLIGESAGKLWPIAIIGKRKIYLYFFFILTTLLSWKTHFHFKIRPSDISACFDILCHSRPVIIYLWISSSDSSPPLLPCHSLGWHECAAEYQLLSLCFCPSVLLISNSISEMTIRGRKKKKGKKGYEMGISWTIKLNYHRLVLPCMC